MSAEGLQLWIPGETVEYRCLCGKEFFSKSAGIRHAAHCTDADDEAGQALLDMNSDLIGSLTPSDAEAWKWGRKRMSEGKVGFKRGRPA